MRRLLCLFAAITCLAVSDGHFQTHQIAGTDLHEKVVEWLKRENIDDSHPAIAIQIAKFLYSVFEGVDQYHSVVPTAFDDQVSEECLEESKSYLDHLKSLDPFALQSNYPLHSVVFNN